MEESRRRLQEKIGTSPTVTVEKFSNWAGTQELSAVLTVRPSNVSEVQSVIKAARELRLRVRATGKSHSWTPIFAEKGGVLLKTDNLGRAGPRIELAQNPDDETSHLVTMVPGVTTGEFLNFQKENKIAFPTNVIIPAVTMGGVISASGHGVGRTAKTVSDYLVRISIVNSDGQVKVYSIKEDEDMMRAVQCSLGLWGIVVEFTLRVEPMIIVETENRWVKIKQLFYDKNYVKNVISSNWSVEIFWFPFSSVTKMELFETMLYHKIAKDDWDPKEDEALVRVINKSSESNHSGDVENVKHHNLKGWLLSKGARLEEEIVAHVPQFAPSFCQFALSEFKRMYNKTHVQYLPDAIHFLEYAEAYPANDVEWAFNHDEECNNFTHAIQSVVDLIHSEAQQGRFPVNLPVEMRFIADSNVYLAPASPANPANGGNGLTCYMEILSVKHTTGWEPFTQKVADVWSRLPGARPHWAKSTGYSTNREGETFRKAYNDEIPKFLRALERSGADPTHMFSNTHLDKVFFPTALERAKSALPRSLLLKFS